MQTKNLLFALPSIILVLSQLAVGTPTPTAEYGNTLAKRTPGPEPHFDPVLGPHSHNGIANTNEDEYYQYNGPSGLQNNEYDLHDDSTDEHWLVKRSEVWDDDTGLRGAGGILEKRDVSYDSKLVKRQQQQYETIELEEEGDHNEEGYAGADGADEDDMMADVPTAGPKATKTATGGAGPIDASDKEVKKRIAKMAEEIPDAPNASNTPKMTASNLKTIERLRRELVEKLTKTMSKPLKNYLASRNRVITGNKAIGSSVKSGMKMTDKGRAMLNKIPDAIERAQAKDQGGNAAKNQAKMKQKGRYTATTTQTKLKNQQLE